jgi:hypothetical protein
VWSKSDTSAVDFWRAARIDVLHRPATMQAALRILLERSIALTVAEGRAGGYECAQALALVLQQDPEPAPPAIPQGLADLPHKALGRARTPIAQAVRNATPYLDWQFYGLESGKVRAEIARGILSAEIVGPDATFHHPGVRFGLFVQAPGIAYATRTHPAEETFYMVGGEGFWSRGDEPERRAIAGEMIHHPSMIPHSSTTRNLPYIAFWRWNGDIRYEAYVLTG